MKASPPRDKRLQPLRLTRFFSLTSLIGIAVVTVCLILSCRELMMRSLVQHESQSHADLSQVFSHSIWGRYHAFVQETRGLSREALLAHPDQQPLHADVMDKMRGLRVVKLKIYNLDGLTVYSTDPQQIGENKSRNEGFLLARAGQLTSAITYRDKFDAFEGTLARRNLIYSYIPVRISGSSTPDAVFEVYSDVTDMLDRQRQAQWQIAGVVLALLGILYLFLYGVVRRADHIMSSQEKDRQHREKLMHHQAHHDALTGLANRVSFGLQLERLVTRAAQGGHGGALLFIDLDHFKQVNDQLGHAAGDQLLRTVAERLRACSGPRVRLFRMGGDEFTAILPRVSQADEVSVLAQHLIASVALPVTLGEHQAQVGASVGIAMYPLDGLNAEEVVRHADVAMYQAKQRGRCQYVFYRPSMADQPVELTPTHAASASHRLSPDQTTATATAVAVV